MYLLGTTGGGKSGPTFSGGKLGGIGRHALAAMVFMTGAGVANAGGLTYERWDNINGLAVEDLLQSSRYPQSPDVTETTSDFSIPADVGDYYGSRLRGYVVPPVTGLYTFWIAGDDQSRFLLSPDVTPENASVVAAVPGWTKPDEWNKYPEQQSAQIHLEAGVPYYVEALHKERSGGDHLTVAWSGPVGARQTVNGNHLLPLDADIDGATSDDDTTPAGDSVIAEYWYGINGLSVDDLRADSRFPDRPDETIELTSMELPVDTADYYGSRIEAKLTAPESGFYRFWVSGDDNAELWLGTDGTADAASLIASVPGWTRSREWEKYDDQRSSEFWLDAGESYYVAALMKERSGGDNLAVAWEGPGFSRAIVGAEHISRWTGLDDNDEGSSDEGSSDEGSSDEGSSDEGSSDDGSSDDGSSDDGSSDEGSSDEGSSNDGSSDEGSSDEGSDNTDGSGSGSDGDVASAIDLGGIEVEYWHGIGGLQVSDLTSSQYFPDEPDYVTRLSSFEIPIDTGDNYGTRIRGFLVPPTTGDYRFWIAGDDESELWLSTDSGASGASMIAEVPRWTTPRQWNKYPEQRSSSIRLEAGRVYYIETLHKERSGGDNLAVAWSGPGFERRVIDGAYLGSWQVLSDDSGNTGDGGGEHDDGTTDEGNSGDDTGDTGGDSTGGGGSDTGGDTSSGDDGGQDSTDGSADDGDGDTSTDEPVVTARDVELEWTAPTERVDGSSMSPYDIDGYRVYWGSADGDGEQSMAIDDGYQTAAVISSLQIGDEYWFSVSTIDRDGLESGRSERVSAVIQSD